MGGLRIAVAKEHCGDEPLNLSATAYVPRCPVCGILGHQQLKVRQFFVLLSPHSHVVTAMHQLLLAKHLRAIQPAEPWEKTAKGSTPGKVTRQRAAPRCGSTELPVLCATY